jgi:hypothetical protein
VARWSPLTNASGQPRLSPNATVDADRCGSAAATTTTTSIRDRSAGTNRQRAIGFARAAARALWPALSIPEKDSWIAPPDEARLRWQRP